MKVRELLSDESKWTKGYYARDKYLHLVSYDDPQAVKFCLMGALDKCYDDYDQWKEALDRLITAVSEKTGIPYLTLPAFNDHPDTKFSDIQEVLAQADI